MIKNQIDPLVIVPNLKFRLSGVTSTIIALLPIQNELMTVMATGPGLPKTIPHISIWKIVFLSRKTLRIWHARRNIEMLAGLLFKVIFRSNLKLIFTSASQRNHTLFTKFLIKKMDYVIATSLAGQTFLDVPSTVLMHGIDTKAFAPPVDKTSLKESLGLPKGILVGCIGRIRPSKGTDIFLEAAIRVLKSEKKITFVIIGRTTEKYREFKNNLEKKVKKQNLEERILFLDEVSWQKIAQFYGCLDLFVAPQRSEGFGLTPLEAMASGVPVIAFNGVGAFDKQIQQNKTGVVLQNKCSEELAKAIKRLLSKKGLLGHYSKNSRKHVVQNFNIFTEAKSLIKIYKQLLKNSVV